MVKKIPVGPILVLMFLGVLLPVGHRILAQPQDSPDERMEFAWVYADTLPPVEYWQIRIRYIGDDGVSQVDTVRTEDDEENFRLDVEVGVKISISVRGYGIDASRFGPWSEWSDEQIGELSEPELPDG